MLGYRVDRRKGGGRCASEASGNGALLAKEVLLTNVVRHLFKGLETGGSDFRFRCQHVGQFHDQCFEGVAGSVVGRVARF
jgi:hypothetical protein